MCSDVYVIVFKPIVFGVNRLGAVTFRPLNVPPTGHPVNTIGVFAEHSVS